MKSILLNFKNSKFTIFIVICLSIITIAALIHYNESRIRYTEDNIVIETNDLNLEYDEMPKEHGVISIVTSSKILLEDTEGIWLYDRDKNEKKLIARVLKKDHVFEKVVYSNDWVVWIEDSDKIFNGGELGKSWIVAAKNINTNEQIIIDKSHEIKNLKYRYAPGDIDISNDTIVYNHIDFQDDEYVFLVKTFNLSTRKLDVIEKIADISDQWITDISICNNKVAWSNPNTSIIEGKRGYRYSDLYLYDIDTREKTKLASGEYMLQQCIYNDNVYTVNYGTELIEINVKTKKRRKIIDETNPIVKDLGGGDNGIISMGMPLADSELLTWVCSLTKEGFYYDLKNSKFKTIGENKHILSISNGYIIYGEDVKGVGYKQLIVPIE